MLEYYALRHARFHPTRANPSDAGIDLPFNPSNFETITIQPGETKILGTGMKFGIPHGYMMQIMNRSSMAAKRQLIVGACVVDAGYNGEVFVNLHNIGSQEQVIEPGDKIAQGVFIPVVNARLIEALDDELYDRNNIVISNRGDGSLGSTGR